MSVYTDYALVPAKSEDERHAFCTIARGEPHTTITPDRVATMDGHAMLLLHRGQPVATASLIDWERRGAGVGVLGHVAVAEEERGKGHASVLMSMIETFARQNEFRTLLLTSVPTAVKFYEREGYKPMTWDEDKLALLDEGHVQMSKTLASRFPMGMRPKSGLTLG